MLDDFDGQRDGSNAFIYSRYLVPHLQGFRDWAIFFDGDGHVNADVYELYDLRDRKYAVQVVKHDYETCSDRKYLGTPLESDNIDYPRKNWSSLVLWNCRHLQNNILTPTNVAEATGEFLHRFGWLNDSQIGELPREWNWLEWEYEHNPDAKLVHHTLGSPGFTYYQDTPSSKDWNGYLLNALHMEGERQVEMVRRAHWNKRTNTWQSSPTTQLCKQR
jgi:lipopolysaccharide biosynthesis glycosyltransferase